MRVDETANDEFEVMNPIKITEPPKEQNADSDNSSGINFGIIIIMGFVFVAVLMAANLYESKRFENILSTEEDEDELTSSYHSSNMIQTNGPSLLTVEDESNDQNQEIKHDQELLDSNLV